MKMRKLFTMALAVVLMAGLVSCSKNNEADASDLLKTVPSDASAVSVFNLGSLLEKSGCKVDGSEVKVGDAKQWLDNVKKPEDKALLEGVLNGESGLEPTTAVFFTEGFNPCFTGLVADVNKFKAWVKAQTGADFSSANGVDVCGKYALKGNQFWYGAGRGVDPADINRFTALSESQSFLSNKCSDRLTKVDKDIECWGNLQGMMNASGVDFQMRAMLQMGMQMLFEDATDIFGSLEFDKGELKIEATALNSKGKPAKYLLPSKKLDVSTMSDLGGTAAGLIGIYIPASLVSDLKKQMGDKVPYLDALSALDGTAAVAMNVDGGLKGVLTTDGKGTSALASILSSMRLSTETQGKLLKFSSAQVSGDTQVSKMAEDLKGSMLGICIGPDALKKFDSTCIPFSYIIVRLADEGSGAALKMELKTVNPDDNSLVSLLKSTQN